MVAKLPINAKMEILNDRRLLVREATEARLEIEWTDLAGERHSIVGTARNASSDGLSGLFPTPIPTGQLVSVSFTGLDIFGHGVVRHSTPAGDEFLIGMAFMGELYST